MISTWTVAQAACEKSKEIEVAGGDEVDGCSLRCGCVRGCHDEMGWGGDSSEGESGRG